MDVNLPTASELSPSVRDTIVRARSRVLIWTFLWSVALAVRLPAAFLLPNAERDGYFYAETIAWLSVNFGHFRLADLFGFWLPLFQLTAAIPNVWIGNPPLFPRYGLIFFTLGLPLLAWLLQFVLAHGKRFRIAQCAVAAVIALSFWQSTRHIPVIFKVLDDFRVHRQVARAVAAALQQSHGENSRCFSDDAAIRVLSGLPVERFVQSNTTPIAVRQNAGDFETYLYEQNVIYLVFTSIEDSLPVKLYPELGRNPRVDVGHLEFVNAAFSTFGPDVWLYRLRND